MDSTRAPTAKSSVTALISPEFPTAPEHLHFAVSNVDLADLRIYTPVILMYEAPVNLDFQAIVGSLKESLRKVLVAYFPLAGRIVKGETGLAEVRCDDSGVFFTEMVVEEELEEFGGHNACVMLSGMEAANLRSDGMYSLNEYDEMIPLVIQVTSFKCKAIALAVSWHHLLADGASGMSFLKAWSEVTRGLPITTPPDHRRHLMSARVPPQPLERCPLGYKVVTLQPHQEDAAQFAEVEKVKRMRKKVEFTMSGDEIQQLKKQAAEGINSSPITSGDCISAHLWKLATIARGLNREESTGIYTVVDGRKRMKDFPQNYFGNCIFVRKAVSSVADVLDMSLGQVAKLIHDSVSVVSDEYCRSALDWLDVTGAHNVVHDRLSLGTHDLQPTFWRYFPIYELDFGFGRPTYGGRNSPVAGNAGFVAVCPSPSRDGSVAISVFLLPDAANNLATTLKL